MRTWTLAGALVFASSIAAAQGADMGSTDDVASPRVEPIADESPRVTLRVAENSYFCVGGYLETFYASRSHDVGWPS